ncbi:MAG TPA: sigma-70 family RNA polymerase sigma factor [Verrucomicrobiae bacterium]|nr:sigma-70 family RNA polymerase sigma factor [Verrucomicrobiae bacterium]
MTLQIYGEAANSGLSPEGEPAGSLAVEESTFVYEAAQSERLRSVRERRHLRLGGSRPGTTDALSQYLYEVGRYELLTKEDEIQFSQQIEAGRDALQQIENGQDAVAHRQAVRQGQDARTQFVQGNLRLVVSIALKYPIPPSMELLDLIQEGNIGLGYAIDKFDWQYGLKFSTYATFAIRHAISRGMDRAANVVRLPSGLPAQLREALRNQTMCQGDQSGDDLQGEMGKAYRAVTPTSLNMPLGEGDDSGELGQIIPSEGPGTEELAAAKVLQHEVRKHLDNASLSPKQKLAMQLRFLDPDDPEPTFQAIGQRMGGVTGEAARMTLDRALASFQRYLRSNNLDDNLLDNRGEL